MPGAECFGAGVGRGAVGNGSQRIEQPFGGRSDVVEGLADLGVGPVEKALTDQGFEGDMQ